MRKHLLIGAAVALVFSAPAYASENEIDQSGTGNLAEINQEEGLGGYSNLIQTGTDNYVMVKQADGLEALDGMLNESTIEQSGAENLVSVDQYSWGSAGDDANTSSVVQTNENDAAFVEQTGTGNASTVVQNDSGFALATVDQKGVDNTAQVTQDGTDAFAFVKQGVGFGIDRDNTATIYQGGAGTAATIIQNDDGNTADIAQHGTLDAAIVTQTGDNNTARLWYDEEGWETSDPANPNTDGDEWDDGEDENPVSGVDEEDPGWGFAPPSRGPQVRPDSVNKTELFVWTGRLYNTTTGAGYSNIMVSGYLNRTVNTTGSIIGQNLTDSDGYFNVESSVPADYVAGDWVIRFHVPRTPINATTILKESYSPAFPLAVHGYSNLTISVPPTSPLNGTTVVTGLLRRQAERLNKRRHRRRFSQYRKRLERFGFVLAHICAWMVFAELSMQVWGGSLFGLGQQAVASARIGVRTEPMPR